MQLVSLILIWWIALVLEPETYLLTKDFGKLKGMLLTLSGSAIATSSKSRRTIRQAASYLT